MISNDLQRFYPTSRVGLDSCSATVHATYTQKKHHRHDSRSPVSKQETDGEEPQPLKETPDGEKKTKSKSKSTRYGHHMAPNDSDRHSPSEEETKTKGHHKSHRNEKWHLYNFKTSDMRSNTHHHRVPQIDIHLIPSKWKNFAVIWWTWHQYLSGGLSKECGLLYFTFLSRPISKIFPSKYRY